MGIWILGYSERNLFASFISYRWYIYPQKDHSVSLTVLIISSRMIEISVISSSGCASSMTEPMISQGTQFLTAVDTVAYTKALCNARRTFLVHCHTGLHSCGHFLPILHMDRA